jgi:hypothetical protein
MKSREEGVPYHWQQLHRKERNSQRTEDIIKWPTRVSIEHKTWVIQYVPERKRRGACTTPPQESEDNPTVILRLQSDNAPDCQPKFHVQFWNAWDSGFIWCQNCSPTSGSNTKTTRRPTQWFALTRFRWNNRSRPLARSRTVWLAPLPYHEESFEGTAFGNRGRDSGGYDDNSKQKNCFWKCCNSCKNAGVHMSVAAGGNCSSSPPTTHRITVEVFDPASTQVSDLSGVLY